MLLFPKLERNHLLNFLVLDVTRHWINASYVIQLIIPNIHRWAPWRWQSPHGKIFAVKPFWPNEIYVKMVGAKGARDCCSGRLFRKVWIQFLLPNKLFYTHTCKVYFCAQISPQCDQKSYEFTFEDLLYFKIGNYFFHFHISNMYTRVAKVVAIHNDLLTQWRPI